MGFPIAPNSSGDYGGDCNAGPQYQPMSDKGRQAVALQLLPLALLNHTLTHWPVVRAVTKIVKMPRHAAGVTPYVLAFKLQTCCQAMPPPLKLKLALTSPSGAAVTLSTIPKHEYFEVCA